MIGLDTGFLIAWALADHPAHAECRARLEYATRQQHTFAVTSGVLAEFLHVVTDPKAVHISAHDAGGHRAKPILGAAASVLHYRAQPRLLSDLREAAWLGALFRRWQPCQRW